MMGWLIALLICGALDPASARARDPDLDASAGELLVALAAVATLSMRGVAGAGAGGGKQPASGGRDACGTKKAKAAAVPTWQPGIADVVRAGVFSYHRQGVFLPLPPPPPSPLPLNTMLPTHPHTPQSPSPFN